MDIVFKIIMFLDHESNSDEKIDNCLENKQKRAKLRVCR